jgi:hypothetical protein
MGVEKTANKRGGISWTWECDAELYEVNNCEKADWLCKLCWDQKKTVIKGMTFAYNMFARDERVLSKSTSPPEIIKALKYIHKWILAGL